MSEPHSRSAFRSLPKQTLYVLTLATILAFTQSSPASAASPVKPGDDVQVFFLNQWRDAKVINTNARGEVLAEYEFAGGPKRRAFKQNEVRLKYEVDALTKLRTWTDATGQFKIQAVLLGSDGEVATLRKPDLSEIKIPINKLSTVDQSMIERLMKTAPAGGATSAKLPPLEKFAVNNASQPMLTVQRAAITPDPLPAYVTLKEGGTAFPKADFHEDICAVIPIGGPDAWLLAATKNAFDKPGRLLWISANKNKVEGQQLLPPGELVLDYHAPSHRLLTFAEYRKHEQYGDATVLTLWEVLPTDKEVKSIVRWDAGSDWKTKPGEPWARLIDGNIVLQRVERHEFVGWDTAKKEARYRITQEAFFAPEPTLSPGRRYLLVPNDKTVRIYETATGQLLSVLPSEDGSAAVAVTTDGRQAAVLGRSKISVWNLTDDSTPPQIYQAETIGTPFESKLSWVGQERLMASNRASHQFLYSLKHKLTLWNYQTDFTSSVHESRGERLREILADHLIYAASVREGANTGFAVGSVRLPGPKVDEADASLNPESLLVLKPGSEVRIDVQAGENNARVKAALEQEVAKNAWRLNPNASATLIAEMKRGETQSVTYRSFDGSREQTVSVTPYISALKIEIGGNTAWQTATSSGAPSMVRLDEDQSAQQEVDRLQKPNVEFFERVDIPEKLTDPARRNGLGTTKVTNRGLVPEPETPGTTTVEDKTFR